MGTLDDLRRWQERRYTFAYMLGIALCSEAAPGIPPVTGHALYGVYIAGPGLIYVGQTGQAERRLRDLPVGESHHIAATVPPEIWNGSWSFSGPSCLLTRRVRSGMQLGGSGSPLAGWPWSIACSYSGRRC
jgi:hypothetical protein